MSRTIELPGPFATSPPEDRTASKPFLYLGYWCFSPELGALHWWAERDGQFATSANTQAALLKKLRYRHPYATERLGNKL